MGRLHLALSGHSLRSARLAPQAEPTLIPAQRNLSPEQISGKIQVFDLSKPMEIP